MRSDLINFYKRVKDIVCEIAEVDESLFTSNKESCVDARYILVSILCGFFTDDEIAKLTGLSRSCANKIRNGARSRLSRFSFRCLYNSAEYRVKRMIDEVATNLL